MTTFSRRYGYDPKIPPQPILEDAPAWLRIAYINQILNPFTFIDDDSRYDNAANSPLGIKALNETICFRLQKEIDSNIYDSWYCQEYLHGLINDGEWYQFYDIVEIVGKQIKTTESFWVKSNSQSDKEQIKRYGFHVYRKLVNDMFAENNVGWQLDSDGLLKREVPESLSENIKATQEELKGVFEPAYEHSRKAARYIYERPLDPENAIKEIVSALESIGRTLYPKTTTLGDVVKELKRANTLPQHLITVIEKFYAFASSEPAVRHGSPTSSRVSLNDAEFCVHVGMALIRYLIATPPPSEKTV